MRVISPLPTVYMLLLIETYRFYYCFSFNDTR